MRRAAGRRVSLRRSPGVADVILGTQAIRRLPLLVEQAGSSRRPLVDLSRATMCRFPWGDPPRRSGQGVRHDHRRVQRVLQLLRGSATRADTSGCDRRPTFWRRSGRLPNRGAGKFSCWDRSSITTPLPTTHRVILPHSWKLFTRSPGSSGSGLRARIHDTSPIGFWKRWLGCPRSCRHLHLPVQSGSSRVLAAMRRRYTRDSYLDLVADIRERAARRGACPTDMIVGFPGETEADFEDTLSLTATVGYHSMFSFKYSPRPNTLADKRLADDVGDEEKTRRIVALQGVQREIQSRLNEALVGQTVEVLIDAASRRRETELSGRTSTNVVVNLPGAAAWIGPDGSRHGRARRAALACGERGGSRRGRKWADR